MNMQHFISLENIPSDCSSKIRAKSWNWKCLELKGETKAQLKWSNMWDKFCNLKYGVSKALFIVHISSMTFHIIGHYAEFDRFLDHIAPGILRYCRISCIIFSIEHPCPFIAMRLLIASYFNASYVHVSRLNLNLRSLIASGFVKSNSKFLPYSFLTQCLMKKFFINARRFLII